jgi:imidazolonepropionase-like amidohydrolase
VGTSKRWATGCEIPKDAEIADLSKSWIMPGLMDAHTYISLGLKSLETWGFTYLYQNNADRALKGLKTAQTLLNAGITTVRDVGNDGAYIAVSLRKAIVSIEIRQLLCS